MSTRATPRRARTASSTAQRQRAANRAGIGEQCSLRGRGRTCRARRARAAAAAARRDSARRGQRVRESEGDCTSVLAGTARRCCVNQIQQQRRGLCDRTESCQHVALHEVNFRGAIVASRENVDRFFSRSHAREPKRRAISVTVPAAPISRVSPCHLTPLKSCRCSCMNVDSP